MKRRIGHPPFLQEKVVYLLSDSGGSLVPYKRVEGSGLADKLLEQLLADLSVDRGLHDTTADQGDASILKTRWSEDCCYQIVNDKSFESPWLLV